MNTYRLVRRDGDGECYWLQAQNAADARRLVALNVPGAERAQNPALFDCAPDETRLPPPGLIQRLLRGPVAIKGA
ncbi:hypothetical protein [Desertibaculum subflavum]|uniref:hypothetical protein n=1 Tax=Desertibaculum subflavum TaxID=2268458 RepID=UPI0013C43E06